MGVHRPSYPCCRKGEMNKRPGAGLIPTWGNDCLPVAPDLGILSSVRILFRTVLFRSHPPPCCVLDVPCRSPFLPRQFVSSLAVTKRRSPDSGRVTYDLR